MFDTFLEEFNDERPHEALSIRTPFEIYNSSERHSDGLPDLDHPFQDRDALVAACRRDLHVRKQINVSTVLAGQRHGTKEGEVGIWPLSFLRHNLGYIDLAQRIFQTIDNLFGTRF